LGVARLILGGAVVDKFGGSFMQTPLSLVCSEGDDVELVHRFVASGADICAVDEDGLLPIHQAIATQRVAILEYFANLLKWKKDLGTKLDRPSLFYYGDRNFGRLPTAQQALELCARWDWAEGVKMFEGSVFSREEIIDTLRQVMKNAVSGFQNIQLLFVEWKGDKIEPKTLLKILSLQNHGDFKLFDSLLELEPEVVLTSLLQYRAFSLITSLMQQEYFEMDVAELYLTKICGHLEFLEKRSMDLYSTIPCPFEICYSLPKFFLKQTAAEYVALALANPAFHGLELIRVLNFFQIKFEGSRRFFEKLVVRAVRQGKEADDVTDILLCFREVNICRNEDGENALFIALLHYPEMDNVMFEALVKWCEFGKKIYDLVSDEERLQIVKNVKEQREEPGLQLGLLHYSRDQESPDPDFKFYKGQRRDVFGHYKGKDMFELAKYLKEKMHFVKFRTLLA
jgi:hypothetical protein